MSILGRHRRTVYVALTACWTVLTIALARERSIWLCLTRETVIVAIERNPPETLVQWRIENKGARKIWVEKIESTCGSTIKSGPAGYLLSGSSVTFEMTLPLERRVAPHAGEIRVLGNSLGILLSEPFVVDASGQAEVWPPSAVFQAGQMLSAVDVRFMTGDCPSSNPSIVEPSGYRATAHRLGRYVWRVEIERAVKKKGVANRSTVSLIKPDTIRMAWEEGIGLEIPVYASGVVQVLPQFVLLPIESRDFPFAKKMQFSHLSEGEELHARIVESEKELEVRVLGPSSAQRWGTAEIVFQYPFEDPVRIEVVTRSGRMIGGFVATSRSED